MREIQGLDFLRRTPPAGLTSVHPKSRPVLAGQASIYRLPTSQLNHYGMQQLEERLASITLHSLLNFKPPGAASDMDYFTPSTAAAPGRPLETKGLPIAAGGPDATHTRYGLGWRLATRTR